jgi:CHAT domain-containing protein
MYDYRELRIRIERDAAGGFKTYASGPSGETSGTFTLPFSELELENMLLRISGQVARGVRRVETPEASLVTGFGGKLFEALFQGRIRDLYHDCLAGSQAQGQGLRITLALTDVPDLMQLPWEFLYDAPDFLSMSVWTPVVRYLDLPRARAALKVEPPLRILALVSSPSDAAALDVEREKAKLEEALGGLVAAKAVEIDWLEQATLRELLRRLQGPPYHIFHYIGHGAYDAQREDGVLLLEDEQGKGDRVSGVKLGTILSDHVSLRLAVLNSCEGARAAAEDPFSGVASSLVQKQIPAVVAMQFEITDQAAIDFAEEFYAALGAGYPVDSALAEGRKAIY